MKNWIEIISEAASVDMQLVEAKMTDGCWTAVTSRQMADLTRKHDLRGVGYEGEVFMWPAEQAVHMRKRRDLGIPSWAGFNFYTATTATAWEYDDEEPDQTLNGRADWVADGARPIFTIGDINVYVEQDSRTDCLQNRQFARLVGRRDGLTEAKRTDGVWSGMTTGNLVTLATHQDLRGVAHDDRIFLASAYEVTHVGLRNRLGLPNQYGEPNYGFDFYCHNCDDDEEVEDRGEWVGEFSDDQFRIGIIGVNTNAEADEALQNRQFARLVSSRGAITEAAIPPTSYGYWITNTGESIPVNQDGDHFPIVRKRMGGETAGNEYHAAMEAGWIRVAGIYANDGDDIEMSADTYGSATSPRAIRQLMKIAKLHPYSRFVHFDETAGVDEIWSNLPQFARSVAETTGQ